VALFLPTPARGWLIELGIAMIIVDLSISVIRGIRAQKESGSA
jgi:hypothetical protein